MAQMKKYETPLCDQLEKGPWPSFVTEIKKAAKTNPFANGVLGQLEQSYKDKIGHWKHGGIVGVLGYGGGVIGRYSDIPDKYPDVEHFHTMRVNQPSGWFYNSESLKQLCDIWDEHGSGLLNMHGSTGDLVFLGTKTDQLEPCFKKLADIGFDLGGSGSDARTPSCCVGPARCEWACYDTLELCYQITMKYQDELHRPAFPYKFKMKMSGCPNDCVASIARSDLAIIGTWKDEIRIDKDAVAQYAADKKLSIQKHVVEKCPARCMAWDGKTLDIENKECTRCMHCINVMPKALRPGTDTGVSLLIGAKAPIIQGAQLASVFVPFLKLTAPYTDDADGVGTLYEFIERLFEVWGEEGKNRERIGEFIQRVGMGKFLEAVGLDPDPKMVAYPRDNPYIYFDQSDK